MRNPLAQSVVIASLALLLCTSSARAQNRDSIDPGRLDSPGRWQGDLKINSQPLAPGLQPGYFNDTGPIRLERYQWNNIQPPPLVVPNIAPYWTRSQELVVPTLPGNQNVLPKQVLGGFAPNTIGLDRPVAPRDAMFQGPIDPGAVEMNPLLFGRVDPGRMPDRLGGPGGGIGRSAIFAREFHTPPAPAGAPSRRTKLGW